MSDDHVWTRPTEPVTLSVPIQPLHVVTVRTTRAEPRDGAEHQPGECVFSDACTDPAGGQHSAVVTDATLSALRAADVRIERVEPVPARELPALYASLCASTPAPLLIDKLHEELYNRAVAAENRWTREHRLEYYATATQRGVSAADSFTWLTHGPLTEEQARCHLETHGPGSVWVREVTDFESVTELP